jgi:YHS domain-containing protein
MKTLALAVFLSGMVTLAVGQVDKARTQHFNTQKSIALQGYDPVSYFSGKPQEGKKEFAYLFKGITYYFISQSNLEKFKRSSNQYEPAYGGWCAFAMGENGEKVKIDPDTYKILGGKLYLFYNFWGNNTLENWNKEEAELKQSADLNWSKIIK